MGSSIMETDNGYITCGMSGEESQGYIFYRIVMTAIDYKGNQLWWRTYGEDFHNYYVGESGGCIKTSDGGYMVSGTVEDTSRAVGLLMKFDKNGDSLWSRIYGDTVSSGNPATSFSGCEQLPDKGYLITGWVYVSGDDGDIILIRTDSLGNTIWEHTYGELHWLEAGWRIVQLPDGKFLIGINKQNLNIFNSMDPGLLKVDSLGNKIWIRYYGGTYDDCGLDVLLSQDGNYIYGSSLGVAEPEPEWPMVKVWIFETDTAGSILWERTYSDWPFLAGGCTNIYELGDGCIIASGYGCFEEGAPGYVGWIIKTKPNGDSIWMRRYSYYPDFDNLLYNIQMTSDNGIILTGWVFGEPEMEQSMWIQKLDSIGCDSVRCDSTVGIAEEPGSMEAWRHGGLDVWPNPASEQINVRFYREDGRFYSELRLEIYDIFGRETSGSLLSSPWMGTGREKSWKMDVSSFSPGIYIAVLRNGLTVLESRKFIIKVIFEKSKITMIY